MDDVDSKTLLSCVRLVLRVERRDFDTAFDLAEPRDFVPGTLSAGTYLTETKSLCMSEERWIIQKNNLKTIIKLDSKMISDQVTKLVGNIF